MSDERKQPKEPDNLQDEQKSINRRDFMRMAGATAAAGALMAGLPEGAAAEPGGPEKIFLPSVHAGGSTQPQAGQVSVAAPPPNPVNVLFVLVDQERFPIFTDTTDNEIWPIGFDPAVELPWHTFLRQNGVTFTNYHTNTALCTPSRSIIYTGQHVPKTGMFDNHSMPYIGDMDSNPAELPTIGHMLRNVGYYTAYKGKWHLSDTQPYGDSSEGALEHYGFSDYQLDGDKGNPLQGYTTDDDIAAEAADWLANTAPKDQPWFLAVNFTNPHDVMYYDPDDEAYNGTSSVPNFDTYPVLDRCGEQVVIDGVPQFTRDVVQGGEAVPSGFQGQMNYDPVGPEDPSNSVVGIYRNADGTVLDSLYGETLTDLVPNFPPDQPGPTPFQVAAHEEFDRLNDAFYSPLAAPNDKDLYRRRLNYYINCIRDVDRHLGTVLQAAQAANFGQNTIVIYTADHGEHCGAHGLVTKGPTMYKENFRCPLIIANARVQSSGRTSDGVACAVDLIPSLLARLGIDDWQTRWPSLKGRDEIDRLIRNPNYNASRGSRTQRGDGMLFTWDAISHNDGAFQDGTSNLPFPDFRKRGQVRGVFDGRYKFGRYFSALNYHRPTTLQELLDNNDLELYDTWNDPTEVNNLADPANPSYSTNLIMEMNDKLNFLLESEVGPDREDGCLGLPIPRSRDFFRVGG